MTKDIHGKPHKSTSTHAAKSAAKSGRRYRSLTITLVFVAVLTTLILSVQYYLSHRIAVNFSRSTAISNQIYLHDKFIIAMAAARDTQDQAELAKYGKVLLETHKTIDSIYEKLASGGEVQITSPEPRTIYIERAYDATEQEALNKLFQKWQDLTVPHKNLSKALQEYLQNGGIFPDFTGVYDFEIANWNRGYVFLFQTRDHLHSEERRLTNLATILNIVAIVLLLGLFAYLVFYSVRRLTVADRVAEAARRETGDIMATVREGLFLIDEDLTIGNQYSSALTKIIATDDVAKRRLPDLLATMISRSEVETVNGFVKQLFNARVKENLIHDLNPLDRVQIHHDNQRGNFVTRWLSFQFNRVYEGKKIARVLVSVSDITNAVLLEQRLNREQEENAQQVEMLANILRIDPKMLNGFLLAAKMRINKINNILRRPHFRAADLRSKVDEIFYEIHSLKGEASVLELTSFITLANNLENKLQELRKMPDLSGDDFLSMTIILDQIIELTKRIELLNRRINDIRNGNGDNDGGSAELDAFLTEAPLQESLLQDQFGRFAAQLAERSGKNVIFRSSGLDSTPLEEPQKSIVKDLIIQIMRNAIVHGIEKPKERQQVGKHSEGRIQVHLRTLEDHSLELVVEDDGRGIDFDKLRQRAGEMQEFAKRDVETLSKKELLEILFTDGYSTATEITEDAGRGVGMGLIKRRILELQGRMNIASINGEFTRFTICFNA